MLRFISIIGIAIAMVVGFVAISTKMKDDFNVRARVIAVLKQMKQLATDELQCASNESNSDKPLQESTLRETESNQPAVELSAELEVIPLEEKDSPCRTREIADA